MPISGTGYTTVVSLTVPAGTYLAGQSVEFEDGSGQSLCYFGPETVSGGDDLTIAVMSSGVRISTSAEGVIALTATTTLQLSCAGGTGATVQRATVTALKVGAAHSGTS